MFELLKARKEVQRNDDLNRYKERCGTCKFYSYVLNSIDLYHRCEVCQYNTRMTDTCKYYKMARKYKRLSHD